MPPIQIYTDGSCRNQIGPDNQPNQKSPGGWGAVILFPDREKPQEISGHVTQATTNQRMELMAALKALNRLPPQQEIQIFTDCKTLFEGMTIHLERWIRQDWKSNTRKKICNQDLWQKLAHAVQRHRRISWQWIRGHNGNPHNEQAHQLARKALP